MNLKPRYVYLCKNTFIFSYEGFKEIRKLFFEILHYFNVFDCYTDKVLFNKNEYESDELLIFIKRIDEARASNKNGKFTKQDIEHIISDVVLLLKNKLEDFTFYYNLQVFEDDFESFYIGKNEILKPNIAIERMKTMISASLYSCDEDFFKEKNSYDVESCFSDGDWVISVPVCNVARSVASKVADKNFKVLQAFFWLYICSEKYVKHRKFSLNIDFIHSKNNFSVVHNKNLRIKHKLNWVNDFLMFIDCNIFIVDLINRMSSSEKLTLLQSKIINSLLWFYDAIIENDDAQAIIKYVIATESIVNFEKGNETSKFKERVFFLTLCCNDRKYTKSDIANIYDLRSRIVHDFRILTDGNRDRSLAFSICRDTIFSFILMSGASLNNDIDSSTAEKKITAYVERMKILYAEFELSGLHSCEFHAFVERQR